MGESTGGGHTGGGHTGGGHTGGGERVQVRFRDATICNRELWRHNIIAVNTAVGIILLVLRTFSFSA